jgi:hypothetical protein
MGMSGIRPHNGHAFSNSLRSFGFRTPSLLSLIGQICSKFPSTGLVPELDYPSVTRRLSFIYLFIFWYL